MKHDFKYNKLQSIIFFFAKTKTTKMCWLLSGHSHNAVVRDMMRQTLSFPISYTCYPFRERCGVINSKQKPYCLFVCVCKHTLTHRFLFITEIESHFSNSKSMSDFLDFQSKLQLHVCAIWNNLFVYGWTDSISYHKVSYTDRIFETFSTR